MPNHAELLRTLYQRLDQEQFDAVAASFTDDYVAHVGSDPQSMNVDQFVGLGQSFFAAMPGLTHTIESISVDGDTAAVRITVSGIHQHDLMGVPGTGRAVRVSAANFFRFRDGKIAEQWLLFDALGMLQQIGAIPT